MRKQEIIIFVVLMLFSVNSFAHSPENITCEYDKSEKLLDIKITHPVYDPATHYIKEVYIYKNGIEIISDNFDKQQNNSDQTLQYVLRDLETGDNITVKALCNVYGKKEENIIITD